MKKLILIILPLFLAAPLAFAQLENATYLRFTGGRQKACSAWSTGYRGDSLEQGDLVASVFSNNFVKNNEFFGPYTEGITYIGSILQPELTLGMTDKLSLTAGWYFRQFYGHDGFEKSLPVIRVEYAFSPTGKLVIGQLHDKFDHHLPEPLYSPDNYFMKNPEYGVQFLYDGKISVDAWMDWEHFILPGAGEQEQITGGVNASVPFNLGKSFGGEFDFPAVIHHHGGQVGGEDYPLMSRANIAPGVELHYRTPCPLVSELKFSSRYVQALDLSLSPTLPYRKGFGLLNSVTAGNNFLDVSAAWWHGEYFFAPLGSAVFQSVSEINNWYYEDTRNLLNTKALLKHTIAPGIILGVRFESYYDTDRAHQDFFYGINLQAEVNRLIRHTPKTK